MEGPGPYFSYQIIIRIALKIDFGFGLRWPVAGLTAKQSTVPPPPIDNSKSEITIARSTSNISAAA